MLVVGALLPCSFFSLREKFLEVFGYGASCFSQLPSLVRLAFAQDLLLPPVPPRTSPPCERLAEGSDYDTFSRGTSSSPPPVSLPAPLSHGRGPPALIFRRPWVRGLWPSFPWTCPPQSLPPLCYQRNWTSRFGRFCCLLTDSTTRSLSSWTGIFPRLFVKIL